MNKASIRELFTIIDDDFSSEVTKCENYKEVKSRELSKRKMIESCLRKEDLNLVEEYLEIKNEMVAIEIEEAFVKGFSLAYQLLIDSIR